MDFYVYYRVRDSDAPGLLRRVIEMQSRLKADHGVAGELKRRPEALDGMQTWMEIYPAAPSGFETFLDQAASHFAAGELIEGCRHMERFMDIGSCA